jgi:penicillin-insensitive murein endopeptidase
LLIGDLSREKGGPISDDHNSHQNGLDADILFWQNPVATKRILTWRERENIYPISLLTDNHKNLDYSKWNPIYGGILKLAASSEKVERIFVNPLIKKKLCTAYRGEDWLRKIRPWWGHDGHFHVRLTCPDDSPLCKPQKPVPDGDGCDTDLDMWLRAIARLKPKKVTEKPIEKPIRSLPKECLTLLSGYQ